MKLGFSRIQPAKSVPPEPRHLSGVGPAAIPRALRLAHLIKTLEVPSAGFVELIGSRRAPQCPWHLPRRRLASAR